MVAMRLSGLNKVRSKGRTYYYHRKSGTRIAAELGTPEFYRQWSDLEARYNKTAKTEPGTLGAVIDEYRLSPFWTRLKPKTRLSYDRAFVVLEAIRPMPLRAISTGFVAKLRDEVMAKNGRWMANYVPTVLRIAFSFAKERGWMDTNPAEDVRPIPRDTDAPDVNRPWSPAECRAVLDAAPPYLKVAIGLAMFAGFRKGDVLTVAKSAVKDGMVSVRTSKRGRSVRIPIHPTLGNVLAQAPQHSSVTLAVNSHGQPWTESGYNSTFSKFIGRLEAEGKVEPGLTMHGLRHTLGTRLKEAGADDSTIADCLAQSSLSMARHYSRLADTSERDRKLIGSAKIFEERAKRKK